MQNRTPKCTTEWDGMLTSVPVPVIKSVSQPQVANMSEPSLDDIEAKLALMFSSESTSSSSTPSPPTTESSSLPLSPSTSFVSQQCTELVTFINDMIMRMQSQPEAAKFFIKLYQMSTMTEAKSQNTENINTSPNILNETLEEQQKVPNYCHPHNEILQQKQDTVTSMNTGKKNAEGHDSAYNTTQGNQMDKPDKEVTSQIKMVKQKQEEIAQRLSIALNEMKHAYNVTNVICSKLYETNEKKTANIFQFMNKIWHCEKDEQKVYKELPNQELETDNAETCDTNTRYEIKKKKRRQKSHKRGDKTSEENITVKYKSEVCTNKNEHGIVATPKIKIVIKRKPEEEEEEEIEDNIENSQQSKRKRENKSYPENDTHNTEFVDSVINKHDLSYTQKRKRCELEAQANQESLYKKLQHLNTRNEILENIQMPEYYCSRASKSTLRYNCKSPGIVELIENTGVYVNNIYLQYCIVEARKNCRALARLLVKEIFTKYALYHCEVPGIKSLAGKSFLDGWALIVLVHYVKEMGKQDDWEAASEFLILKSIGYVMYNMKRMR